MATGVPSGRPRKKGESAEARANGRKSALVLSYPNKKSEDEILRYRPACGFAQLWPELRGRLHKLSPNALFFADNLDVLAHLADDSTVRGKVNLVYIDPPYSTKSVFHSRDLTHAYEDTLTGPEYAEFLRERLVLLRECMTPSGSIYVHLDEKMLSHMKIIMDEVFGDTNFRNLIVRKKCNPKNYTHKTYGKTADYILFYTRSSSYTWNRPVDLWTDERARKEYEYVERETGRRFKKVPVHAPGHRNGETGKRWRDMLPPPGKHWQFTPEKLDELDARGEIYWSPNGNPRRKVYLENSSGVSVQDIWLDFRDAHNQNIRITGYPTEKNPDLLRRIVLASSNPGDLVLDCFSGSGTTLDVAHSLGRRWIGVDSGIEAIVTTLERFAVGTQPMGDFVQARLANGAQHEVPSLFDEAVGTSPASKDTPRATPVTSFTLYADERRCGELADALGQWRGAVSSR
jgi:adenine-specific DNA-methyltransferase